MKIKIAADPESGSLRVVSRFAWLPVKIDNTTMIWLEKYYQVQRYRAYEHVDIDGHWYDTPIKSLTPETLLMQARLAKEIA